MCVLERKESDPLVRVKNKKMKCSSKRNREKLNDSRERKRQIFATNLSNCGWSPDPQHSVLRERMKEKGFTHMETAIVDIPNIHIKGKYASKMAFFCHIRDIIVHEQVSPGDGGKIPHKAEFKGISLPDMNGYYDLKKVILSSNGKMQIVKTPKTSWVKVMSA